jgi:hypothetical protein
MIFAASIFQTLGFKTKAITPSKRPEIMSPRYMILKTYIPQGIGNPGFFKTKIKNEFPKLYRIGTTMDPIPTIREALDNFFFLLV